MTKPRPSKRDDVLQEQLKVATDALNEIADHARKAIYGSACQWCRVEHGHRRSCPTFISAQALRDIERVGSAKR